MSWKTSLAELCTIFPVTPTWAYHITLRSCEDAGQNIVYRENFRIYCFLYIINQKWGPAEIVDLITKCYSIRKINRSGPGPVRRTRPDVTAYKHSTAGSVRGDMNNTSAEKWKFYLCVKYTIHKRGDMINDHVLPRMVTARLRTLKCCLQRRELLGGTSNILSH